MPFHVLAANLANISFHAGIEALRVELRPSLHWKGLLFIARASRLYRAAPPGRTGRGPEGTGNCSSCYGLLPVSQSRSSSCSDIESGFRPGLRVGPALGLQWSRDSCPMLTFATTNQALDQRKRTNGGCSVPIVRTVFDRLGALLVQSYYGGGKASLRIMCQ